MKKIACAAALSLAATSAFAGGFDDPVIDVVDIVEETSSSKGGILVPLIALILIAAAVSD